MGELQSMALLWQKDAKNPHGLVTLEHKTAILSSWT